MHRIGERIKNKREQLGLQLKELASLVGISSSALSQIEKLKTYPSIITLKLIANNLQTTVGELVGENETLIHKPVFHKDEYVFIEKNISGTELYLLTKHDSSKQMEPFLLKFKKGTDSLDLFTSYRNQIFCYLLSGELLFEIDNQSYVIQAGDTLNFNGKRNFKMQNINQGNSVLICNSILSST